MEGGNWIPAVWRSPELANATTNYAKDMSRLHRLSDMPNLSINLTSPQLIMNFQSSEPIAPGCIPILKSRGADGQRIIRSAPDDYRLPKNADLQMHRFKENSYPQAIKISNKAGYLLVTDGQSSNTARLTAVASDSKYVGVAWMPVRGLSPEEAKATAVFLNSTVGRLQIMSNASRKLEFPMYRPASYSNICIPEIKDTRIRGILSDCWERTKDMIVPQFRDGECEVRQLWDEAVAEAMGWDSEELTRLRLLLHQEPHVRGLGYNQYADEVVVEPGDRERFVELADQWENETVFYSNSTQMIQHPAYREIVSMGEPAVPLILERMRETGRHWDHALGDITGTNPVKRSDRGKIPAVQASWLEWGEVNGYI